MTPLAPLPRTKSIFPRFRVGDTLHVQLCGNTLDIEDGNRRVERLLELMDGTRTADEVVGDMVGEFPGLSRDEVAEAIQRFDDVRLLEDAARDEHLDPYDDERWNRDRGFFETYASLTTSKYELQRRVQDSKVALLGVGGVGSHVLMDLLGLGVKDIRIVDFDRLELSNLNRQVLYRFEDIGRPKVQAAAERARAYQPRVQLDAVERRLGSADDVADVVADRDIVLAAVDTPKMHVANWVNEGCVATGTTLITGGVDIQRAYHYTVIPGETGCTACWRAQTEEDPTDAAINAEHERIQAALTPGQRFGQDFAAFGALVAVQTACLVTEFVRVSSAIAPPLAAGRMMALRFEDLAIEPAETWNRLPDCGVCGHVAPSSGRRGAA